MNRTPAFLAPALTTLAFLLLVSTLGYFTGRENANLSGGLFAALFLLYVLIARQETAYDDWWVVLGLAARLILVFSPTLWSDDVYRFIWDGRCWLQGLHPFLQTPDALAGRGFPVPGLTEELYRKLNSPEHYTVYPPAAQAVFFLAAWASPNSIGGSIVVIKLFLLACEAGNVVALRRLQAGQPGRSWALLYALNPLAILEGCGNAHFDVAALCGVLWGLLFLQEHRPMRSAAVWSAGIALKLTPLLFLPLLWRFLGFRRGFVYMVVVGGCSALFFLPVLTDEVVQHMGRSLDLYFRQFQFNASVYYLVRWAGYRRLGYDIGEYSGPVLGALTLLMVLVVALRVTPERSGGTVGRLAGGMTWASFAHLSLSAVVHPWYVLLPFGVCLPGRWRFPLVWTGLAVLSYSHYHDGAFTERYGLIALEYGLLWLCVSGEISLYLWRSRRQSSPPDFGTTH